MVLGTVLFGTALAIGLAPVAWHKYVEYQDNKISPLIASHSQFEDILRVVLNDLDLDGEPPPPPEPGEPPRPILQKPIVLIDETAAFCDAKEPTKAGCESEEDGILYPGIDAIIPLKFRKELIAANRVSARFVCHESVRVQCARPEAVFAPLAQGGSWHNFYSRFPKTAGFVHASNVVLSRDGKSALAYIVYGCGSTCGAGILVQLKRTDTTWVIVEQVHASDA